ncbi:hypothetical protein DRQ07_01490 [candidate division KSB1 bacterium]|nr:MAG: hypothetical protein DRQ07_01490 [candidate division KSB1 bacterium]
MNTRDFAKEFQRPFLSNWDKNFFSIFVLTLIFETVVVYFLAKQPIQQYSQKDIKRIQERFARFVLQPESDKKENVVASSVPGSAENVAKTEPGKSEKSGTGEGEQGGEGKNTETGSQPGSPGRASSKTAIEARRKTREAVSRSVSDKGVLGLLTASTSSSDGVSSILDNEGGSSAESENLDDVLSSVTGLKSSGQPGGVGTGSGSGSGSGIRGGRKGKSATIDDLVSDLETTGSSSMQRKGDLVVEAPDQVKGRGRKSIYRSPAAIQEVLLAHSSAIRFCYERELKRYPTLKGKISIRITVAPNGSVKKAEIVSSTLNNRRVERCILSRIRLWKDFKPIKEEEGDVTFRQIWSFGY